MIRNLVVLLSVLICGVWAYPNGAPTVACEHMTPGHTPHLPQAEPSPYILEARTEEDQVVVSITTRDDYHFEGFLLQARNGSLPVGTFVATDPLSKTIDCTGGLKNAITHNSKDRKLSMEVTWMPPENFTSVNFTLTVVHEFDVFWINQILPYNAGVNLQFSLAILCASLFIHRYL